MSQFDGLPTGCLDGVTVIDFTWVLSGPHASKILADMGATVIKVEPYQVGANERHLLLTKTVDGVEQSSYSIHVNRGKKSISLDLKKPQAKEIIAKLIKKADVLIENYTPGALERLGLGYEAVKKLKEDIIYCSISCFGHWGPYSNRPGYDIIAQGASGLSLMNEIPQASPISPGDIIAGTNAAVAVLGALFARSVNGRGQNIDISMVDSLVATAESYIPWYTISQAVGEELDFPPVGRFYDTYAPFGTYQGKDGRINIACLEAQRWPGLVAAMGEKYVWLMDDPRTMDVSTRCMNAPWLNSIVEEWVMSMDSVHEVERLLTEAGVACQRCLTVPEIVDTDPHIKAREMFIEVEQPFLGTMKLCNSPIKMSETPSCLRGYGPLLGEHTDEVLAHVLGYSEEQIKDLYDNKIIYHEPAVDRLKTGSKNK
jgi:crotonobetainyl-CoA:carnitine CoA-transferase CaiB-like acyl-CoA transferase